MGSIQSVSRAFQVLRKLSGGPAGVTELADRTELPKSTVARMLSTLVELGAVEHVDGSSDYRIGPLIGELAVDLGPSVSLFDAARPHLTELVDQTGETAGLSVLVGDEVLYLDQIATDAAVQVRDWRGERVPAHLVSSGLILLAAAGTVPSGPLEPTTDRSITSVEELTERLEVVSEAGFVWTDREFLEDLTSVAAPIWDYDQVVAAIHVHGPSYRFPGDRSPQLVETLVVDAARRISNQLASAHHRRLLIDAPA